MHQELKEQLDSGFQEKARQSYSGGAKKANDENAAEAMMIQGMAVVGVQGKDFAEMPKGALEKQVQVWWLRKSTAASRAWINQ